MRVRVPAVQPWQTPRMSDTNGYAVFLFPPALDVLGDAIKPYLQTGAAGPFIGCREVDTAGAFIEMTLEGRNPDGRSIELELMVPGSMVRMIVSAHSDAEFGFYDRNRPAPVMLEPGMGGTPGQTEPAGTDHEDAAKP